jgi:hypothetical protein
MFGRFCQSQQLWPDSRFSASANSHLHTALVVAFSSNPGVLLAAFPVCYQQHCRVQAKIVISRGLACAQNSGRLAKRVGFLPPRYRFPPSLLQSCPRKAHSHLLH